MVRKASRASQTLSLSSEVRESIYLWLNESLAFGGGASQSTNAEFPSLVATGTTLGSNKSYMTMSKWKSLEY